MKEEKTPRPRKKVKANTDKVVSEPVNNVDQLTSDKVALENKVTAIESMLNFTQNKLEIQTTEYTQAMSDIKRHKDAYHKLLIVNTDLQNKLDRIPGFIKSLFGVK